MLKHQKKKRNSKSILKTKKTITFCEVNGGISPNIELKTRPGLLELFLKIPQSKKILEFLDLKRDYKNYAKNKISNLKL